MQLPNGSIIVSGPVIIENNKVLLDKEYSLRNVGSITPWYFPGGEVEDFDIPLEETCRREVREELGIEIEIIKPLKTTLGQKAGGRVILAHFLAKRNGEIRPGKDIADWGWHDINNLPENCAPNIYEIINNFKKYERANP